MWWLGVLLACSAALLSNFAVTLQKFSIEREHLIQGPLDQRKIYQQPLYLLGLTLLVLASLLDIVALSQAAQSLLAPLYGLSLLSNLFWARFWLHEQVMRRHVMGTVLILLGSIRGLTIWQPYRCRVDYR